MEYSMNENYEVLKNGIIHQKNYLVKLKNMMWTILIVDIIHMV